MGKSTGDRKRPRDEGADASDQPPSRPTRRRGRELLDAIHEAAIMEAAEAGVARLSMEGIARRSGTAKTSLYRRWPAPVDILVDAMYHAYPQEEPTPGADDLRGDLVSALLLLREVMSTPLGTALFSLVASSVHDPALSARFEKEVFDARGGRFTRTVLDHYAAHGRIDPSRVTPVTVDIGEAMLIKYALDHRTVPDPEYVRQIVDQVVLPAIGQDPRGSRPAEDTDTPAADPSGGSVH